MLFQKAHFLTLS